MQYYKSQGDDNYGFNFGKGFFVISGSSILYVSKGLNFDCIFGIEWYLISLQYFDSDFLGQELVGQVYYCDELLWYYLFLMVNVNKQVMVFFLLQQDIDQYGMKLILNS